MISQYQSFWYNLYYGTKCFPIIYFSCKQFLSVTNWSIILAKYNVEFKITFIYLQIGEIEGQPHRKGVFPVCFVHVLNDWQ